MWKRAVGPAGGSLSAEQRPVQQSADRARRKSKDVPVLSALTFKPVRMTKYPNLP
jgi:hypothetical protein